MLDYSAARESEGVGVATIYTVQVSPYLDWVASNGLAGLTTPHRLWLIAGMNQCVEVICDADDAPTFEISEEE
ncbi:hypothetical protein [Qipengyuania sp. 902]|uniref:hypothetical protein n=1 Tax=Qipengyuania sp. 902 TaxID=3417565 RepID=UPI003EBF1F44